MVRNHLAHLVSFRVGRGSDRRPRGTHRCLTEQMPAGCTLGPGRSMRVTERDLPVTARAESRREHPLPTSFRGFSSRALGHCDCQIPFSSWTESQTFAHASIVLEARLPL